MREFAMIYAVVALSFVSISCGRDDYGYGSGDREPQGPDDPGYAEVKPLVDQDCGRCHHPGGQRPYFTGSVAFKNSRALSELRAGAMPPDGRISASDKAALITYLQQ